MTPEEQKQYDSLVSTFKTKVDEGTATLKTEVAELKSKNSEYESLKTKCLELEAKAKLMTEKDGMKNSAH